MATLDNYEQFAFFFYMSEWRSYCSRKQSPEPGLECHFKNLVASHHVCGGMTGTQQGDKLQRLISSSWKRWIGASTKRMEDLSEGLLDEIR